MRSRFNIWARRFGLGARHARCMQRYGHRAGANAKCKAWIEDTRNRQHLAIGSWGGLCASGLDGGHSQFPEDEITAALTGDFGSWRAAREMFARYGHRAGANQMQGWINDVIFETNRDHGADYVRQVLTASKIPSG